LQDRADRWRPAEDFKVVKLGRQEDERREKKSKGMLKRRRSMFGGELQSDVEGAKSWIASSGCLKVGCELSL
jgi:hypothetical protein